MPQLTIGIGAAFMILGIVSYVTTQMQSWTALIPAIIGILFIILGAVARKESARKMSMHIAMFLGLVGLIGSFPGLIKFIPLMTGDDVARPGAVVAQTIMAILLIYYLGMGIKTFIVARKSTNAKE